jgi:hypothetical protein
MKLKALLFVGLLLVTAAAYAGVFETYALTWSGASFGNNATANGLMTSTLPLCLTRADSKMTSPVT